MLHIYLYAFASLLFGSVWGLICVAIFSVALKKIVQKDPKEVVKIFMWLLGTISGGGGIDYAIFDFVLQTSDGFICYILGFCIMFLVFGLWTFIEWKRKKGN